MTFKATAKESMLQSLDYLFLLFSEPGVPSAVSHLPPQPGVFCPFLNRFSQSWLMDSAVSSCLTWDSPSLFSQRPLL